MGYTNYWTRPRTIADDVLRLAAADCSKVCIACNDQPGGGGDEPAAITNAEFSHDGVFFDGSPAGCEAFCMDRVIPADDHSLRRPLGRRDRFFQFCKTERLGYDLAVKCCLIVFRVRLGIDISSDGRKGDEDGNVVGWEDWTARRWQQAAALCQTVLGYGGDVAPMLKLPDME
jgi:hypothetical protein